MNTQQTFDLSLYKLKEEDIQKWKLKKNKVNIGGSKLAAVFEECVVCA